MQAGAKPQAVGAVSNKVIETTLRNVRYFVERGVTYGLVALLQQRAGGIGNARNGVRAGILPGVTVGAHVGAGKNVAVAGVIGVAIIYHCTFAPA